MWSAMCVLNQKISVLRRLDCSVLEEHIISTVKNVAYMLYRKKSARKYKAHYYAFQRMEAGTANPSDRGSVLIFNIGLTVAAATSGNVCAKDIYFLMEMNDSYMNIGFSENEEEMRGNCPGGMSATFRPSYGACAPRSFFPAGFTCLKCWRRCDGRHSIIHTLLPRREKGRQHALLPPLSGQTATTGRAVGGA